MCTIDLATTLDDLAHAIAQDGAEAHHAQLAFLAEEARGDAPAAAAVLADPLAPDVVRQRAFGLVHGVLVRQERSGRSLATAARRVAELYRLAA
ncbi:hypothetical protein P0L94_00660 [Microbacter sp. GSS18]|nr:hypothetical protein P0L94_00660 [Microbacter sp. GSS18]